MVSYSTQSVASSAVCLRSQLPGCSLAFRMELLIRQAELADLPSLLGLDRSSVTAPHWSESQYLNMMQAMQAGSVGTVRSLLLVAVAAVDPSSDPSAEPEGNASGAIAGMLVAKGVLDEWEIENLAVLPQFQRMGVAKALLHNLLDRVRAAHGTGVFLEMRESNEPARKLYERFGFRETGCRRGYYREPTEAAILYAFTGLG